MIDSFPSGHRSTGAWAAPAASRTYARNGLNQYTNVSGTAFAYDGRGNLTSDGSRTFAYDLENRLTSVSGSASATLAYDPLGRLRTMTAGGATTTFVYAGDQLIAEYNGAALLRRYAFGAGVDRPLVWYEGAGLTVRNTLHADELGSVIATSNGSGVGTIYSYGPYGEPANDNWTGSRFRYTGQIALPEVRLYHYKARVYDPRLGRFLQTDPVGYEDGLNLYAYVRNDPLNRSDPTGELGLLGGAIGAVVGAAFETGRQLYINNGDWSRVDGNTIIAATVVGAAVGATAGLASGVVALTGATGAAAAATVAIPTATVAATGSAVVTMIDNQAQGQPIPQNVLRNAAISAVAAPAGEAAGNAATAAFSRSVTQGGGEVLRSSTVAVASAAAVAAEATTRTVQESVAEHPDDEIRR